MALTVSGLFAQPAVAHSGRKHKKPKTAASVASPSSAAANDASPATARESMTAEGNSSNPNASHPDASDPTHAAAPGNAIPAGQPEFPSPAVLFTFNQPGGHPQEFTVSVQSTGLATYSSCNVMCKGQPPVTSADAVSTGLTTSAGEDPFWRTFTVTAKTRERIFSLARAANYFDGDFDYTKHRIANSGTKTLGYTEGPRKFKTTYNWSENPGIQELTNFFLNLSSTQEGGRRLLFLQRYDKLGLEAELKALQTLSHENHLPEVESISPVLQAIVADRAVMHITRQRAQKLLDTMVTGKPADLH